MIDIKQNGDTYIFAIGDVNIKHRIQTSSDVIKGLASIDSDEIENIQEGNKTWELNDWKMSAAGPQNQHQRDMQRKRIHLEIGELAWHLLGLEVHKICIRCRTLLEQ